MTSHTDEGPTDHPALDADGLFRWELRQLQEAGHDVAALSGIHIAPGVPLNDPVVLTAFADAARCPRRDDWPWIEPDDLEEIKAVADWPTPERQVGVDDRYADRTRAAWIGRVAGNMLGKPVESGDEWTHERIATHLRAQDAWPLRDYFPPALPAAPLPPYREFWPETTAGNISGSSRDDDIDYTIVNLDVLRRHGADFRTDDIAMAWLTMLPFLQTFTAERAAIRNLVQGLGVERAATFCNPYREWIGAMIRADVFGYVCPGDPGRAAELAYRDAALSHAANGIYGEMWAAALIAAAYSAESVHDALDRSLAVVPRESRLHAAVDRVRGQHSAGWSWDRTRADIDVTLGHYGWVHTVNNAAIVTAGLLHGDGDFTRTIGLTVSGGLDTDSNGATAGSVAGILSGTKAIDAHWVVPLRDHVRSAVPGYDGSSIEHLARLTIEVAESMVSAIVV